MAIESVEAARHAQNGTDLENSEKNFIGTNTDHPAINYIMATDEGEVVGAISVTERGVFTTGAIDLSEAQYNQESDESEESD